MSIISLRLRRKLLIKFCLLH